MVSCRFDFKMILIYLILIVCTITQVTCSQKIYQHLCCPISRRDQKPILNVDCDKESPGGKPHDTYYWGVPGNLTSPSQTDPAIFQLKYKEMKCRDGVMRVVVSKSSQLPEFPRHVENVTFLRVNSYVQIDEEYYHPNEYCLHKFNEETIELNVCQSNCFSLDNFEGNSLKSKVKEKSQDERPRSTTCIQKCCASGESISNNGRWHCAKTDVQFTPSIYAGHNRPLSSSEQQSIDFHILHSQTKDIICPPGTGKQILPFSYEHAKKTKNIASNLCFQTHKDGSVFYRDPKWNWKQAQNYCIDAVQEYRTSDRNDRTDETEFVIVTCSEPSISAEIIGQQRTNQRLYGGVMISSSFFLLLTFIVYALLWDQKGLHGWTTLGHSSSMFFSYIFLGTAHILGVKEGGDLLRTFHCAIVGVLAHFFLLANFCWLALISFDLWWTFRALNPKVSRSRGARRFLFYVFCGWICPSIVVIISLILDSQYAKKECSTIITTQYGQLSCYVQQEALGEYVFYPIAGLLCLNLIFFCLTIWKLYEYKKTTRIATSNLESKRQFFKLFVKLFFVCGITWVFEVISWLHVGTETTWYWTVIDIVNVLQAIEVFIMLKDGGWCLSLMLCCWLGKNELCNGERWCGPSFVVLPTTLTNNVNNGINSV